MNENQELLTVSDVSMIFDKSRQTIHNWVKTGRFANSFAVGEGRGRVILIPASDVEAVKLEEVERLRTELTHLDTFEKCPI